MKLYVLMVTYYFYLNDGTVNSVSDCVGAFGSLVRLRNYKKMIESNDPMAKCWVKETTLDDPKY